MKTGLALALILFGLPCCAHSQTIAHITTQQQVASGTLIHVSDTAIIVDPANRDWSVNAGGSLREVLGFPVSEVITVKITKESSIVPVILGGLAGMAIGGLIGASSYEDKGTSETLDDLAKSGSVFFGMLIGSVVGGGVGLIVNSAMSGGEDMFYPYKPGDLEALRSMAVFPEEIPSSLNR